MPTFGLEIPSKVIQTLGAFSFCRILASFVVFLCAKKRQNAKITNTILLFLAKNDKEA